MALVAVVVTCVAGPGRGEKPAELTTVRAVAEAHLLPDAPPPVRLESVVIGRHPTGAILVRDATGATFVRPSADGVAIAPGDRLRVRGSVYAGVFIDGVTAATVENLGPGPAPEPVPVTPSDLSAGSFFHDLVTATGVVRSVAAGDRADGQTLRLNVSGGVIEARLDAPVAAEEAARWIGAEVRITGFGSGEAGPDRNMLRPFVRLPDAAGMRIVTPAPPDPFAGPAVSLDRIGRFYGSAGRVKVAGVAAARGGTGGGLFLAADGRGLFVQPALADDALRRIRPGDRVEAAGFVTASAASPVLGDAVVRVTGTGAIPALSPLIESWTDSQGDWFQRLRAELWRDAVPVEFTMAVTERSDRADGTELLGRTIVRGMSVRCMVPARAAGAAVPGSEARVRGVYRITRTDGDAHSVPVAIDVWPASAADVVVVKAAPWWTAQRLAAALGVGVGILAMALGWVALLRWQVRRQARELAMTLQSQHVAAIEFETSLRERNRLAANLHDTVLQTVTGINYQLQAAQALGSRADGNDPGYLAVAGRMVAHAIQQLRGTVWALHTQPGGDQPLTASLESLVARLGEGRETCIRLHVAGTDAPVSEFIAGNLLLFVGEAITNALKHAAATAIDVTTTFHADGSLTVSVRDDGRGFQVGTQPGPALGHFGIEAMMDRMQAVGGRLQIESRGGRGTTVTAEVPPLAGDDLSDRAGADPAADG